MEEWVSVEVKWDWPWVSEADWWLCGGLFYYCPYFFVCLKFLMRWSSHFNVWSTASTRRPKEDKSIHTILVPLKVSCSASQSNKERGSTRETLLGTPLPSSPWRIMWDWTACISIMIRITPSAPAYPTPMVLFVSVHFSPQIIGGLRTWTYSRW